MYKLALLIKYTLVITKPFDTECRVAKNTLLTFAHRIFSQEFSGEMEDMI